MFKVDPSGTETVLHTFLGAPDGSFPYAGMVLDGAGNLYGTTMYGGAGGHGTVFEIDASGGEMILHDFAGGSADGAFPEAVLLLDSQGNIYGTTYEGGPFNKGTVFEIKK